MKEFRLCGNSMLNQLHVKVHAAYLEKHNIHDKVNERFRKGKSRVIWNLSDDILGDISFQSMSIKSRLIFYWLQLENSTM